MNSLPVTALVLAYLVNLLKLRTSVDKLPVNRQALSVKFKLQGCGVLSDVHSGSSINHDDNPRLSPAVQALVVLWLCIGSGQVSAADNCVDVAEGEPEACLCVSLRDLVAADAEELRAQQTATGLNARWFASSYLDAPDTAGVKSCSVLDDAEKATFQCVWTYPLTSAIAQQHYERVTAEVQHCVDVVFDGEVKLQQDQAVNHPDVYASQFYQHPGGQITVSLKNKSALSSKLLTIRVDAYNP